MFAHVSVLEKCSTFSLFIGFYYRWLFYGSHHTLQSHCGNFFPLYDLIILQLGRLYFIYMKFRQQSCKKTYPFNICYQKIFWAIYYFWLISLYILPEAIRFHSWNSKPLHDSWALLSFLLLLFYFRYSKMISRKLLTSQNYLDSLSLSKLFLVQKF